MTRRSNGKVAAVACHHEHRFSKSVVPAIRLIEGLGVADDAHLGKTVQHLSRIAKDPTQPNLRQVHLIHVELFDELAARAFTLAAGDLGENILTHGVDLLALPRGTLLHIGKDAILRITGLRNPCRQIEAFQPGLMHAVLDTAPDGALIRKCGVMAVVDRGGRVSAGDAIEIQLPAAPWKPLEPV